MSRQKFCFATLAMGQEYSALAALLAKDIAQFSPESCLVVLTDRPDDFNLHLNVLAFYHWQQSLNCHQDKVYVIREALSLFDSCMFLEADMRILAPFQPDEDWRPGIMAKSCSSISKDFAAPIKNAHQAQRKFSVLQKAARKLNLDLQDEGIKLVHEFLFVVTKDAGKEANFLTLWEQLGRFFELNGLFDEGYAIGLAAAKAGLAIQDYRMENLKFFKKEVEQVKIEEGQADACQTLAYFETCNLPTPTDRSFLYKVLDWLHKYRQLINRAIRLRIASLKNFNFYYR
ncbi:MAG TPA: hypothetical protein V6C57_01790 [Coleofasciculaceae cyanobacterium]